MATAADIEAVIPGAQGRILGALMRLDGPRTISDVARLADVSRDRAADVVAELERLGLVERRRVGRAHLISLIEENPITESLRQIERVHERSVDRLKRAARSIRPTPRFMALYGSWARREATANPISTSPSSPTLTPVETHCSKHSTDGLWWRGVSQDAGLARGRRRPRPHTAGCGSRSDATR